MLISRLQDSEVCLSAAVCRGERLTGAPNLASGEGLRCGTMTKRQMFSISLLENPNRLWGVDVGEGVILRYDEARREVVGLTLIGLRVRLLKGLAGNVGQKLP